MLLLVWTTWSRRLALLGALSVTALATPRSTAPAAASLARLPHLILWAWESPEDLRALAPDPGVAFLAQTIRLAPDAFSVRPRLQPLRVDRRTALVAVTRVEVSRSTALASSAIDVDGVSAAIAGTAILPQVAFAQVDFDAAASERPFYRRLLEHLRARMDPAIGLSITALASWCVGDEWLHGLPIDEAVPMLFRIAAYARGSLGVVRPRFARRYLVQGYRVFSGRSPLAASALPRETLVTPWPQGPGEEWAALSDGILDSRTAWSWQFQWRGLATYQQFLNCPDSAFAQAVRTLQARIQRYGESSAEVKDWTRAQVAVIQNCHGDDLIVPSAAFASADPLILADREYQTAAACFYATQYDEAARRFRTIAADPTSPWRPYGRYLAAHKRPHGGTRLAAEACGHDTARTSLRAQILQTRSNI